MKQHILILTALMIIMIFTACTNSLDGPVGPAVWIKPANEDGSVNWDNYYFVRVVYEYTFDANKEGWKAGYASDGRQPSCIFVPEGHIKCSINNLQPDEKGNLWLDWNVDRSVDPDDLPIRDFTTLAKDGEILVFEFRVYSTNGTNYPPLKLDLQFGLDWAYFLTNYPPGTYDVDYSKCFYSVPETISVEKDLDGNRIWTEVRFAYTDLKRTSWTSYPELTRNIWMKNIAAIYIVPTGETYDKGFNTSFLFDDFKIVIYKHKSIYDPTQAP